ncbi:MAG: phenylacetate-CoA oxygenase subunit PaaJ [Acidimicrobiia bacterium]|nr:phenylacetate-CoA oxygenase subunit PaaJ [Acidimicrobiia bacterium]
MTPGGDLADVRAALDSVTDPEIPVLTIRDLGILRDVSAEGDALTVTITPTYSGCPAMDTIRADIRSALSDVWTGSVEIATVMWPAWTTDWMSEDGKRKLAAFGIAPPGPTGEADAVLCPRCRSDGPVLVSRFGSTACKALYVCDSCGEPFDHFKAI